MADWSLYERIAGRYGDSGKEFAIGQAKMDFKRQALSNPGYRDDVLRNGVVQKFIIDRTDVSYKNKFIAFPDEDLFVGDEMVVEGEKFIIVETRVVNAIQTVGVGWLCNLTLFYQNHTSDVLSCECVLDSGVYSTTRNGDEIVRYADKQFKIYMPYDDNTKKLYIDKRIATGCRYDSFGNEILEVYIITGLNTVARSYGTNGHLLVLEIRSDNYNENADNKALMVCDYIKPVTPAPLNSDLLKCSISGAPTIRGGQSKLYKPVFYDADNCVVEGIAPIWKNSQLPDGITVTSIGDNLRLTVAAFDALIGETVRFTLTDSNNLYNESIIDVEVNG